jgi:hypothetical protein
MGKKLLSLFCRFILCQEVFNVFSHGAVSFSGSFFDVGMNLFADGNAFVAFSWQKF